MNLFVCEKCNGVESVETMGRLTKPHYSVVDNIRLAHTEGQRTNINTESELADNPTPRFLMLCSECHSGTWHGEFDKMQATDVEVAMAAYSKHRMITPLDQGFKCLIRDESMRAGWNIDPIYKMMSEQVNDVCREYGFGLMTAQLHPLYSVWIATGSSFDIGCLAELDILDPESIEVAILSSISDIRMQSHNSIYKNVHMLLPTEMRLYNLLNQVNIPNRMVRLAEFTDTVNSFADHIEVDSELNSVEKNKLAAVVMSYSVG